MGTVHCQLHSEHLGDRDTSYWGVYKAVFRDNLLGKEEQTPVCGALSQK